MKIILYLCILLFLYPHFLSASEIRQALIIGNSGYSGNAELKNPVNDANLMTDTLKNHGFEVTVHLDADYRTMKNAIQKFSVELNENSIGLFYFAGHGMEINGRNYLIPVGANLDEANVEFESIDAARILKSFELANNGLNMLILDACRNNPYKKSDFRSLHSRGLVRIPAPKGTLILYATQPGNVAEDGIKDNGLFTDHLVRSININGLKIEDVFKQAAINVNKFE